MGKRWYKDREDADLGIAMEEIENIKENILTLIVDAAGGTPTDGQVLTWDTATSTFVWADNT